MSRLYSASQYDASPKRLGVWEAVDTAKMTKPGASPPAKKTADGRTLPIVDEKGHLLPGHKKPGRGAARAAPAGRPAPPRWPEQNASWPTAAAATMGFKGIQTDYLPSDTVPLPTVVIPGCRERNYAGGPH